jgi:2,3-bisphosphoglycerate-dependent phosphoglycerate mutase
MTQVYFVRHAKSDYSVHDDYARPLTEQGCIDCKKVTEFLLKRNINKIFSSPYKRTVDTVKDFAETINLKIHIIDGFRERAVTEGWWVEDFNSFAKEQWNNFDYKLPGGESLNEVQERNIKSLMELLSNNVDQNIVIGSHGTALSTVVNYFNKNFGYSEFDRIKHIMPFIVCFTFDGQDIINIEEFIL